MLFNERPIAVDLYSGAGGLSLGFEQAGFDIAAAVEFDPVHAATHDYNFAYGTTTCADVRAITGSQIRERSEIGTRDIAVVTGGPPCQGFSLMGKRSLDDPRNQLLLEFVRLVAELAPEYFVMENVAGLTVGNHRRLLDETIEAFEASGYEVMRPFQVLNAADFGVPQSRRRVFLIGARRGAAPVSYPEPTTIARTFKGKPLIDTRGLPLGPSVADAIFDLPDADRFTELLDRDWVKARMGKPSQYASKLRMPSDDPDDFSHHRPNDLQIMTCSPRTVHTELSQSRFADTVPGEVEPISRFLRLHPDGVCNTLRAGTASDRGAYTSPRPIHPVHARCITVREAARLHGYPDWFRFHSTKWHGFRQIGNSVPPPLGRAVAAGLIKALGLRGQPRLDVPYGDLAFLTVTPSSATELFGLQRNPIDQRRRKSV